MLGVAIGFRNDALITIPPFVLLVMAAAHHPAARVAATRCGLAAGRPWIRGLSSPVLQAYANGGGSASSHAAFLGLMRPVDSALGVSNGGLYEVGYGLEDSYAAAVVSGYASRAAGALRLRDTAQNMTLPRPTTTCPWCGPCLRTR